MTDPTKMARLQRLLDIYGAEPTRWPAAERGAAEALLRQSAEARARLANAARLDDLLAQVRSPRPSAALVARLAALATPPRAAAARPFARKLLSPAVLALAATLALAVGLSFYTLVPGLSGDGGDLYADLAEDETSAVLGLTEDTVWPTGGATVALALY